MNRVSSIIFIFFISLLNLFAQSFQPIRFAVIGDYGSGSANELAVSQLIKSWNPDFIITVGDNNYLNGADSTIDQNIGQFYHDFIFPYLGSWGPGATINRFFPALGNHDWNTPGATPYMDYFTLPGNERYYDFVKGPVHFFVIDSDPREPDSVLVTSTQAAWLQNRLAASRATWKLVYMHHPPYSSGAVHGSQTVMQWPYQAWGATAVLTGHDHTYERLIVNGFPYFVNGLGGYSRYTFGTPVSGSVKQYNNTFGAMQVEANEDSITFRFISLGDTIIDIYVIHAPTPANHSLKQNYPNPFNLSTTIEYDLPSAGLVSMKVYNILGQEVQTLVNGVQAARHWRIQWETKNIASGIYFYRLQAPGFLQTKKLILIK